MHILTRIMYYDILYQNFKSGIYFFLKYILSLDWFVPVKLEKKIIIVNKGYKFSFSVRLTYVL